MKIKTITITKNNINAIYGRLRKFFYNKNKTGFLSWHNFDCGFRHISSIIEFDGEKMNTEYKYPEPLKIFFSLNHTAVTVTLTATDAFILREGDKIAFCGNRIITRSKWCTPDYNFIYQVFQVEPMSSEERHKLHEKAKEEEEFYLANDYE